MKARVIEYDEKGKIIKKWDAVVGFAPATKGKPITIDWNRRGTKTRFIGVYVPVKPLLNLLISRIF